MVGPQQGTYYDLLGVSRVATTKDIKAAYRKAALLCHPDVQVQAAAVNPDADAAFKALTEAYECLRDQNKRYLYDMKLREHEAGPRPDTGGAASDFTWNGFRDEMAAQKAKEKAKERRERDAQHAEAWWVAEKAEAERQKVAFRKVSAERMAAADTRKIRVLSRYWQTSGGVIWQDVLAVASLSGAMLYTAYRIKTAFVDNEAARLAAREAAAAGELAGLTAAASDVVPVVLLGAAVAAASVEEAPVLAAAAGAAGLREGAAIFGAGDQSPVLQEKAAADRSSAGAAGIAGTVVARGAGGVAAAG